MFIYNSNNILYNNNIIPIRMFDWVSKTKKIFIIYYVPTGYILQYEYN